MSNHKRIVRDTNCFFLAFEWDYRQNRAEDLLAADLQIVARIQITVGIWNREVWHGGSPFCPVLETSGIVSGNSAQNVAGEADFQCRAKNVCGSSGAGILLQVVKIEQEARMKA